MDLFQTFKDVNKFIGDLTVKRHLFSADGNETSPAGKDTRTMDLNSKGTDIFPLQAYFSKHISTKTLMDLQEDSNIEDFESQANAIVSTATNCERKPNPDFYPVQSRTSSMDNFQTVVEREVTLLDFVTFPNTSHNLTYRAHVALKSLSNNPHIVIYPSDKGDPLSFLRRRHLLGSH